jgi:hypothetical protein
MATPMCEKYIPDLLTRKVNFTFLKLFGLRITKKTEIAGSRIKNNITDKTKLNSNLVKRFKKRQKINEIIIILDICFTVIRRVFFFQLINIAMAIRKNIGKKIGASNFS